MRHFCAWMALVLVSASSLSLVEACGCAYRPPDRLYSEADAVFLGRLIAATQLKPEPGFLIGGTDYQFEIEKAYRGLAGRRTVHVQTGATSCGATFDLEERYLVFAAGDEDRGYGTGTCFGSRKFAVESPMYRFLERVDAKDYRSFITGRIQPPYLDDGLKQRLGLLEVVLEGQGITRSVIVAAGEDFLFDDLVPGDYRLRLTLPADYDSQPIERSTRLRVPMGFDSVSFPIPPRPGGGIILSIQDALGETCPITAFVEGEGDSIARPTHTDSSGTWKAFHLPPNNYRFVMSYQNAERAEFPPPDSPPIPVVAGRDKNLGTWRLPVAFERKVVQGRVLMPDGTPAVNAAVKLNGGCSHIETRTDAHGRFVLRACHPFRYGVLLATWESEEDLRVRYTGHRNVDWSLDDPPPDLVLQLR